MVLSMDRIGTRLLTAGNEVLNSPLILGVFMPQATSSLSDISTGDHEEVEETVQRQLPDANFDLDPAPTF